MLHGRFIKPHIPTGGISPEAIVRFAIEELGAPGRRGQDRTVRRDRAGSTA